MAEAKRDQNFVPSALGVSSADGVTTLPLLVDPITGRLLTDNSGATGTVTSVSVVSANGFAGTVATATTTPAITLTTTVTGILSGNGTAISAASTTGSGSVVLATSPTLVTPALGTPTALVGTNITGTAAALSIGGNAATATSATTATTATNLAGGAGGSIPYQTSSGVTAMLANGSAGNVLQSNGTTLAPTWAAAPAASLTVGSTSISSGTTTRILYDNAGTLGEYTLTGTGTVVVMATSPTITTAALGSSTATTQTPADNSTKLATTAYVDNAVLGQRQKEACLVATTAALTGVYLNGASGVGATFTYTATGTNTIDGVTLALGNRVLVKNQASTFQNGIYTVTTAGAIGVAGILTRGTDFDQSSDIQTGDTTFITSGTALANTTWTYNGIDSPVMGTDAITFVQAAGPGSYTQGAGITITGTSIAITAPVTVALGGTNATSASITAFNNITGYSAAGATGTTSTNLVFSTSPTLVTPILGTPTSGTLTNCTGYPVANIANLGTGVATALAVNVGSAGAFVTFNGAGGTPSSMTATNLSGTAASLTAGTASAVAVGGITGLGSNVATFLATPSSANFAAAVTGETGTGAVVFGTSPDFTTAVTLGGVALPTISSTDTLTNKRITPRVLSAAAYTTNTGSSINGDTQDMFIVTAQTGALKFNNPSGTPTDGQKFIITVASSTTSARALTWDTAYGSTTVTLPTTTAATTGTLSIGFIWSASKSLWQCVAVA